MSFKVPSSISSKYSRAKRPTTVPVVGAPHQIP
ncbi:hypothetical protein VN97_g12190, partial [Penicillium thymicola]